MNVVFTKFAKFATVLFSCCNVFQSQVVICLYVTLMILQCTFLCTNFFESEHVLQLHMLVVYNPYIM